MHYKEVVTKTILGDVEGAVYKVTIKNTIVATKCKVIVDDTDLTNIDESKIIGIGELTERIGRPTGKVKIYLYDANEVQVGEVYQVTPIKVADW